MANSTAHIFFNASKHSINDGFIEKFDDEDTPTLSSEEQIKVEKSVERLFKLFFKTAELDPEAPVLLTDLHIAFLRQYLTHLPTSYQHCLYLVNIVAWLKYIYTFFITWLKPRNKLKCLDASRPWLCYWIIHSLVLLKCSLSEEDVLHISQFLNRCQSENGGFGGGPGQLPHLAPTYAAVNALCSLGTPEAYNVINREKLKKFLWSVRDVNGAFSMHVGGEVDIRGLYCALSVARLTHIYSDDLFDKSAQWIVSCQTYEGGFSGFPGMEAHGGYAFCGIAALTLLGREHLCDIRALLRWTVNRQMKYEGGFQGRTNKLVDGCYSFWQGGALPLLHRILCNQGDDSLHLDHWLFQSRALQQYILICCQYPSGGLIDKPSKPRDVYHTCYTLSGLSVAQHLPVGKPDVIGSYDNLLAPLHPVYNIGLDRVKDALAYFMQLPVPQ